jgi:hypothetical protein
VKYLWLLDPAVLLALAGAALVGMVSLVAGIGGIVRFRRREQATTEASLPKRVPGASLRERQESSC